MAILPVVEVIVWVLAESLRPSPAVPAIAFIVMPVPAVKDPLT